MSRATGLINKLNGILKRFTPLDRLVYKRVIVSTGGDALLGRSGTVSVTDTLFDPQPFYTRIDNVLADNLTKNGINVTAGDYEFLFSPDAVTYSDISDKSFEVILKDSSNRLEVLRLLSWESPSMNSTVVAFSVYMRSVQR
jgi:hypothetical protein